MPTRLYFHSTLDTTVGLPGAEQSTMTSNKNVDAQTVNRSMNTSIGTAQSTLILSSNATLSLQNYYFTRFISPPIFQSSILANTWTYNFATSENLSSANFPVTSTNKPVWINLYVWRPSTSAKVGTILDGNTTSTVDEGTSASVNAHHVLFTGAPVSSMSNNDVLCLEIWFAVTQGSSLAKTDTFYYNGTTVNVIDNAVVTNHASFIETPETLALSIAPATILPRAKRQYFSVNEYGLNSDIINI